MKLRPILTMALGVVLSGCTSAPPDYHLHRLDRSCDQMISDSPATVSSTQQLIYGEFMAVIADYGDNSYLIAFRVGSCPSDSATAKAISANPNVKAKNIIAVKVVGPRDDLMRLKGKRCVAMDVSSSGAHLQYRLLSSPPLPAQSGKGE